MDGGTGEPNITALLRSQRDAVLDRWVELVVEGIRSRITEREVRTELTELYGLVERTFSDRDETAGGELRAALAEISRTRARQGFTPTETAIGVFSLKRAVHEKLETAGDDSYAEFIEFSAYIDDLGLATFEAYTATREQVISDQAEQLLELATPVVKMWDGILGVPLVGTLDSARAQAVMETMLQMIADTGSKYAVIDITGVAAVDTEVAQHMLKTAMAARLMGAECVISGIRPQIAQTIATLGIDFGDMVTKASLADALEHALRGNGLRVIARTEA
ncbi:STAS domain-containing protein [Actinomadura welshii]